MKQPEIEIRIGELVLHGFPPVNRILVKEAVEAHLAALLREGDFSQQFATNRSVDNIRAAPAGLTADATPATIGKHIARSIYGGIRK